MKTKLVQKTSPIVHRIMLCSFCFVIAAFTGPDARSSTNTPQVDIEVRFVRLEPSYDWPEKSDWYPKSSAGNGMFTAALTDAQFKDVLKALDEHNGLDLLDEREIKGLSGTKATFEGGDVVTNAEKDAIRRGVYLELIPTVLADGYTIQMTLTQSWDLTLLPGSPDSPVFPPLSAPVTTLSRVMPPSHVWSIVTNSNVQNGETIVLGNLRHEFAFNTPESRWKTIDVSGARKSELILLVTPTLIDSSESGIHSKDYYDSPGFPAGPGGGGFGGGGFNR